jgi:hypothetical protein
VLCEVTLSRRTWFSSAIDANLDLSRDRGSSSLSILVLLGGVIVVPGAGRRPGGPAGCGSPVGWHQALDGGQARVPADVTGPLVSQFRHAVRVGLSQVPSVPGANAKQLPGRSLLECLRDRQDDLLRFCSDTRVWPTNNISERDLRPLKTQQRISGGSSPRTSPATGSPSAATSPPPPNTALTS